MSGHPTPAQPEDESRDDRIGPLGGLVEQEARRMLSDEQRQPDPELVAAGWERRFIADAFRVREVIDLYTELGYEVQAVPVRADELDDDCEDCSLVALLKLSTIYTRPRQPPNTDGDPPAK